MHLALDAFMNAATHVGWPILSEADDTMTPILVASHIAEPRSCSTGLRIARMWQEKSSVQALKLILYIAGRGI